MSRIMQAGVKYIQESDYVVKADSPQGSLFVYIYLYQIYKAF